MAATSTHLSKPMLSACAKRKQARIISISLLTTDKHRRAEINSYSPVGANPT
ncbi:MAG: hypothetical protein K8R17_11090 [Methanosarcinales archaeon]|nr:hypothetical protein [Methanosarcinales archaeon]